MMMEIQLSPEKAMANNYSIDSCYQALDKYFINAGISKISQGVYYCNDFGKFSVAQITLSKTEWFTDIVEQWYWRIKSEHIE